jgi:hypothetical protein
MPVVTILCHGTANSTNRGTSSGSELVITRISALLTGQEGEQWILNEGAGTQELRDQNRVSGGFMGVFAGEGVEANAEASVRFVKRTLEREKHLTVNLAGHSRGSITCYKIAYKLLQTYGTNLPVNIFILDNNSDSPFGSLRMYSKLMMRIKKYKDYASVNPFKTGAAGLTNFAMSGFNVDKHRIANVAGTKNAWGTNKWAATDKGADNRERADHHGLGMNAALGRMLKADPHHKACLDHRAGIRPSPLAIACFSASCAGGVSNQLPWRRNTGLGRLVLVRERPRLHDSRRKRARRKIAQRQGG